MKNRLVVAAKAEQQKRKQVSPQPKPIKKKIESPKAKKTEGGEVSGIFTCPEAKRMSQLFSIQIETPISLHTALERAGTPQKCLIHDNVSTLFCTVQRRPICAMCMYQNNTHKSHKVLPIHKASQLLNSELEAALAYVKNLLDRASSQIAIRDLKINQIELDYPTLMRELQTFYTQIQHKLLEKQSQQMQFLSETWIQSKQMHSAIGVEMKKIKSYALERVRQIDSRKRQTSLIFNFNIATELRKLDTFFGQENEELMPNKYFDEIKKFKQLEPLISTMLAFSQKESLTKQFDKKNSKPSFRRQGEASSKPKKNGSGLEGEHNLSLEERESIDKHEKKEKSPPRNRHAASEVKLKLELTDRRRQMEKKMLNKSTSLLRERSQSKPNLSTAKPAVNPHPEKKSPRKQSIPS